MFAEGVRNQLLFRLTSIVPSQAVPISFMKLWCKADSVAYPEDLIRPAFPTDCDYILLIVSPPDHGINRRDKVFPDRAGKGFVSGQYRESLSECSEDKGRV